MSIRRGYAFLSTAGRMPMHHRLELVKTAITMFYNEETKKMVDTDHYGGMIEHKGEAVLGHIGGHQFDANVDGEYGKTKLSFIINDKSDCTMDEIMTDIAIAYAQMAADQPKPKTNEPEYLN